jgi:addiction module HigA family antidote
MREVLTETLEIPIAEAARRMGVSRTALYAVLDGKSAVTPGMAVRFAELTNGEPDLYVLMQMKLALWRATR